MPTIFGGAGDQPVGCAANLPILAVANGSGAPGSRSKATNSGQLSASRSRPPASISPSMGRLGPASRGPAAVWIGKVHPTRPMASETRRGQRPWTRRSKWAANAVIPGRSPSRMAGLVDEHGGDKHVAPYRQQAGHTLIKKITPGSRGRSSADPVARNGSRQGRRRPSLTPAQTNSATTI